MICRSSHANEILSFSDSFQFLHLQLLTIISVFFTTFLLGRIFQSLIFSFHNFLFPLLQSPLQNIYLLIHILSVNVLHTYYKPSMKSNSLCSWDTHSPRRDRRISRHVSYVHMTLTVIEAIGELCRCSRGALWEHCQCPTHIPMAPSASIYRDSLLFHTPLCLGLGGRRVSYSGPSSMLKFFMASWKF